MLPIVGCLYTSSVVTGLMVHVYKEKGGGPALARISGILVSVLLLMVCGFVTFAK